MQVRTTTWRTSPADASVVRCPICRVQSLRSELLAFGLGLRFVPHDEICLVSAGSVGTLEGPSPWHSTSRAGCAFGWEHVNGTGGHAVCCFFFVRVCKHGFGGRRISLPMGPTSSLECPGSCGAAAVFSFRLSFHLCKLHLPSRLSPFVGPTVYLCHPMCRFPFPRVP